MTEIRDIASADIDWLLRLNNEAVPHVNHLERQDLDGLLAMACYARLALIDDRPMAALIGFWPGTDYESAHYCWFSDRFEDFFYVDRVIVADGARGKGVGQAIYDDIERFASDRTTRIALEVNSLPPNPVSMRFHQIRGFVEVGDMTHEGGAKKVVMMVKTLPPVSSRPEG